MPAHAHQFAQGRILQKFTNILFRKADPHTLLTDPPPDLEFPSINLFRNVNLDQRLEYVPLAKKYPVSNFLARVHFSLIIECEIS
jgi:hypothetical protein